MKSPQGLIDLTGDVLDGLLARPGRFMLLAAVFAIGSGGFVAAAGVSLSAAHQITQQLTPSDLDEVIVREVRPGDFPSDAKARAESIDVVRAAGAVWPLDPGTVSIAALPTIAGRSTTSVAGPVFGGDAAWLRIQEPTVTPAAAVDQLSGSASDHVAIVGADLAGRLHLPGAGPGVKIWIQSTPFDVVGTITQARRDPGLRDSVVISPVAARALVSSATGVMTVRTQAGAASAVARTVATTIRPERPTALDVDPVLDLEQLRRGVQTDLDRSIAAISALILVFATLSCGNAMVVAVVARTGEIGLRRALGSSRPAVAGLFLMEGAITGLAGGLLGSALGLVTVIVVAATRGWTPVVSMFTLPLGPVIGLVVGVTAAIYPALRASNTQPAIAVRQTA